MNCNNLKKNWPIAVGAIGMFIYFGVGHFVPLPDALRCFLLGFTVACLILGAVAARVGTEQLRHWKKSLLQRYK